MCRLTQPPQDTADTNVDDFLNTTNINPAETHDVSHPKSSPIGNPIELIKDPSWTRLYFQNPDGLTVGNGGDIESIFEHAIDMQCDHLVLPETKLDTHQRWVKSKVHNHCRRIFGLGSYRATMAASTLKYSTTRKPGGVMGITVGHLAGRVLETGSDSMGRWVHTKFSASGEHNITVIGIYQPPDKSIKIAGPTTATTQQYSLLDQAGRHNPHRVNHHYTNDLTAFVKRCQQNKELVIVGGDFNETLGDNNDGLTKLCSDCELIDINQTKHGTDTHSFSTHIAGSKCIDYMLMDPQLVDSVERCGYEPFRIRIPGDHRGMYVDVNTTLFFGSATTPPAPLNARLLHSRKVNQTAPYFDNMEQHLNTHKWHDQIADLQDCMQRNIRNDALAEKLDRRRIAACKEAASKLKRYPRPPYSPQIARLRNIEALLRLAMYQLRNPQDDYLEAMDNVRLKLGSLDIEIPPTIEELRQMRAQNLKLLRVMEREELKIGGARSDHQTSLIDMYKQAGQTLSAKAVKKIQRAEAMNRVWQECAQARGLNKNQGLAYVLVPEDPEEDPKTCTRWKKVDDPIEVRSKVSARLQKHFSQAKDCNLTSPPLDVTMDFEGTCAKAEAILNGTYDTSQMDDTTQWLLHHLQYTVGSQDAVDPTITADDFEGKIKVWNERTSTSPATDVHLGHAKAYYALHTLPKDSPEEERLENIRSSILKGHLLLLNYALQFGYSYDRWQTIVNALLEKDPGTPKIHRLRVIHLYEWDFNLILGVKWRQLLHRMCDSDMVNPSLYGGVPGKTTLDPVFIREMEYELCRLIRHPVVHFDNDAMSCYDRIPCFLANVASRKYGMNAKVCVVQGMTLRQAKYYLKTKFGLSDEYVSHTQEMPWFGTGQGSGNSPMYWLVISSTLFDAYQQRCTGGATYHSADKSMTLQLHQLGFVDDVMNRTNHSWETPDPDEALTALIDQASQDSQLWRDLIESSNQALELNKCKYHVIHYNFANDGEPMVSTSDQPPAPLRVHDNTGQPVTITHVPNSKAIKYLGFLKCIHNQTEQKDALKKKADGYARVVNCSPLSRTGARIFYRGIYKLSVDYVLPLTYFTESQLETVQKKAHKSFLNKCGYHRNTKLAVVYGPIHWGGIEFFHLYDLQGYGQVATFIKYWRTPKTQSGQMLRLVMSWIQYCAGTGSSVLMDVETKMPHLESMWITSMRDYLASIGARLELLQEYIPERQREGDTYIMDHVLAHATFKPKQIKAINWCRLYLGVVTIADMSNAAGTHILQGMYDGDKTAINNTNRWHQVHQKRPDSKSWKQWQRFCRLVAPWRCRLLNSLGDWIVPVTQLRRQWQTWQVANSNQLYVLDDSGTFTSHQRLHACYDKDPLLEQQALPPDAMPVDVTDTDQTYRVGPNYHRWAEPPTPPVATWQMPDHFQTLSQPWEQQLLGAIELLVPQDELITAMTMAAVKVAADGSVQGSRASFGWVLSDKDGRRLARCNGPAYGAKPTSYRAEAYGILSAVRFFYHLQAKWQVTNAFHIYCDNKSMVNRSNENRRVPDAKPNSTLESEWDVLAEIWTTLKMFPEWNITWIKGHQDDNTPYNRLELPAQLNVDADALADAYIVDNPDHPYNIVPLLPTSGIQLHLPVGTITHNLKKAIRLARTEPAMREHLMDRFSWDEDTFEDIDWEGFRRAMGRLDKHRVTLTKHVNNYVAVGRRVNRYDPKYPRECVTCGAAEETADHLILCPPRDQWRKDCLTAVRNHFSKDDNRWDAPVELQELLLEGVKSVLEDRDPSTIHCAQSVAHILAAQTAIGWGELFRGRLSCSWQQCQSDFLGDRATKRVNGQTWSASIAQLLLQQWHNLWLERNGDRHGHDKQSRDTAAKKQAHREVDQLYEYKGHLRTHHNWILAMPSEERKKQRTYILRAWINSFGPILKASHEYQTRLETG